jgi:cobalamin biosynthesis Mg chelatase CobN
MATSTGTTGVPLSRRLVWSKQGLDNKLHTVVATHAGSAGHAISLDFFRSVELVSVALACSSPVSASVLGFASLPPINGNSGQQSSGSSTIVQGNTVQANTVQVNTVQAKTSGGSSATTSGSYSAATSQTVSGPSNHPSPGGTFNPTIIITGTSPNHAQITGDGINMSGTQEQQQQQNSSNNINVGVIVGSAIGATALVILAIFLLWYRRMSRRQHISRMCLIISTHYQHTYILSISALDSLGPH